MKLNTSKTWLSLVSSLALSLPLVLSCGKNNPAGLDRLAATAVDHAVETAVLQNLHAANQDEIAAGKLAQQQASAQAVKDLAKSLVDDHTKADQQVVDVAKRANVSLGESEEQPAAPNAPGTPSPAPGAPATGPTAPAAPATPPTPPSSGTTSPGSAGGGGTMGEGSGDPLASLRSLSGQEFDREFLTMMTEDHTEMIAKLGEALPKLGDSETAKLVKQLQPVLQSHLDKAKKLLEGLGGSMTPEGGKKGKCGKGQDCQQQQQQQQKPEKCDKGQDCQQPKPPVSPKPVTPPVQQQQQQGQVSPVSPKPPVTPVSPKPPVTPVSPKPPVTGQQGTGGQGHH